jgi:hypothetical protein
MMLDVVGSDSTRRANEIGSGERPPDGQTAAALGLRLKDGKGSGPSNDRRTAWPLPTLSQSTDFRYRFVPLSTRQAARTHP